MTPATKFLDKNKCKYSILQYECDAKSDFGVIAAEKLKKPQDQVYKTLITHCDKNYVTAVIPVNTVLNLKKAAKLAGLKRLEMVKPSDAEKLTGYVCGGISPFGQKRQNITIVSDVSEIVETMIVSGGRRGLSIEIEPSSLCSLLNAKVGDITDQIN